MICLALLFKTIVLASGTVYLVLGSDTAIWDGMDTGRFHCTYRLDLYTDPAHNGYAVMDPSFRTQLIDSYGQPLKLTWWMMAGNIFRYATNNNVPIPNIMALYLMKQYHGDMIKDYGDELSLHYHTFLWSDYNADGIYFWNQSKTFLECFDDFNFTLAQFLLEEEIFPVSYRSGWHYMDNDWQHYLDELLPFSMHNDWPNVRTDTTEPLDNTYDWSLSPRDFVPYHPSKENYQMPGDGAGWNVRSTHLSTCRYHDLLDTLFNHASKGQNQLACIWGHLPETDFLFNIEKIDSIAHEMEKRYPEVKFRYCTAIEAMQYWLNSSDKEAPALEIEEIRNGEKIIFKISSDGSIFQSNPFIAVKDIYENYRVLQCEKIADNVWQCKEEILLKTLAKVGVAVCDHVGNQAIKILRYLPDDIFIDNLSENYQELDGSWRSISNAAWGLEARAAELAGADSAKVRWSLPIAQSGLYNLFLQFPAMENPAQRIHFRIYSDLQLTDTISWDSSPASNEWIYLITTSLEAEKQNHLEMIVNADGQLGRQIAADVLKISAMVRELELYIAEEIIHINEVSQNDTSTFKLTIYNRGYKSLLISNINSLQGYCYFEGELPVEIGPMDYVVLNLNFYSDHTGGITDSLLITSNDTNQPYYKIGIQAQVEKYFEIVDNEKSASYLESGSWFFSNAQAYGPTSRYAPLNSKPLAFAVFTTTLKINGIYEILEIVPSTVNASNNAQYVVMIGDMGIDTLMIDQNSESGSWVSLGRYHLPANIPIHVKVQDTGKSTAGLVLRADAIRFALIEAMTDLNLVQDEPIHKNYILGQNYPNPFNPVTNISFYLPKSGHSTLAVFDLNGRLVRSMLNGFLQNGWHTIQWDGQSANRLEAAAGVYIYLLKAGGQTLSRKMVKLH